MTVNWFCILDTGEFSSSMKLTSSKNTEQNICQWHTPGEMFFLVCHISCFFHVISNFPKNSNFFGVIENETS